MVAFSNRKTAHTFAETALATTALPSGRISVDLSVRKWPPIFPVKKRLAAREPVLAYRLLTTFCGLTSAAAQRLNLNASSLNFEKPFAIIICCSHLVPNIIKPAPYGNLFEPVVERKYDVFRRTLTDQANPWSRRPGARVSCRRWKRSNIGGKKPLRSTKRGLFEEPLRFFAAAFASHV